MLFQMGILLREWGTRAPIPPVMSVAVGTAIADHRRVGPGNFTPSRSQNRARLSPVHSRHRHDGCPQPFTGTSVFRLRSALPRFEQDNDCSEYLPRGGFGGPLRAFPLRSSFAGSTSQPFLNYLGGQETSLTSSVHRREPTRSAGRFTPANCSIPRPRERRMANWSETRLHLAES